VIRLEAGKHLVVCEGGDLMDGSKMEKFMLKELLMIIAALVVVSVGLLGIVIVGNY